MPQRRSKQKQRGSRPEARGGRQVIRQIAQSELERIYRPVLTRGSRNPPRLELANQVYHSRIRFRNTSTGTVTVTGDCIANLLGYQTTSAIVARLAHTIRPVRVEVWGTAGTTGDTDTKTSSGVVRLTLSNENTSSGLTPIMPTSFDDTGSRDASAHLSVAFPVGQIIDCNRTNRWNLFQFDGPLGAVLDITVEWTMHRGDIYTNYTLTSVTTTVGLVPFNGYLDNTAIGGGVGQNRMARDSTIAGMDFGAYG